MDLVIGKQSQNIKCATYKFFGAENLVAEITNMLSGANLTSRQLGDSQNYPKWCVSIIRRIKRDLIFIISKHIRTQLRNKVR